MVDITERRSFTRAHPSLVRAINRRSVIEALDHHGRLSRAQTARVVGLAKPTVSEVFTELLNLGAIRQAGRTHGSQGPKAALYEVNHEVAWVVGVDVGRRWIRAALSDLSGRIVQRRDERVRLRSNKVLLDQISGISRAVVAEQGLEWEQVKQVTIGSPGVINPSRRLMMLAADLPGWEHEGLLETVRELLGVPIEFENDVNLAALGERWQGHGRQFDTFAYLWIGTGAGLGLIIDGRLYRGVHGLAGEIGNLPIYSEDGSADESRTRVPRTAGWYKSPPVIAALDRLAKERDYDGQPTLERVFSMAREGDPLARGVVDLQAGLIARAVATVAAIVDPSAVILGGGVGHNGDLLLPPIEQELKSLSPFPPIIMNSALGTDAVLHGAIGTSVAASWDQLLGPASAS